MNDSLSSALNGVADGWANWMLPIAWQVALLVTILGALTWLLRARSARLRYALWMLVPVRLILPPSLAFATGWGWWLLPAEDQSPGPVTPAKDRAADVVSEHITAPQTAFDGAPRRSSEAFAFVDRSRQPTANAESGHSSASTTSRIDAPLTWKAWVFCAWLMGVAALSLRMLYGWAEARRMLRKSSPWTDADGPASVCMNLLVRNLQQRLAIRRAVQIRSLDEASSPMLLGIWRPTILMPRRLSERLTKEELEAVIHHELHHAARRDAEVSLLQRALGVAYFYHPFVWAANRMLDRLREDACDEATVASLEGRRGEYGAGIVKVAEMIVDAPPNLALGIAESSKQVKRRLRRILDPRLPIGRRLSWLTTLYMVALAAVVLPCAPRRVSSAMQAAEVEQKAEEKSSAAA
ncbi:MAG: M56 family metallopeptidase, partial [Planctomycetota bacterium]